MSYNNNARAATAYREREVMTASPARLVVLVYDHVLANLNRAKVARDVKRTDVQLEAIGKAREGLAELLVTLDLEKGGAIAKQLQSLYTFMLTELVDAAKMDAKRFDRIIAMVNDLREAFVAIANDGTARTTAA